MQTAYRTLTFTVVAALLGGAIAWGAAAPPASEDDVFYGGLEARKLSSLMEAYLKAKSAAQATPTPGTTPAVGAGSNALALANVEYQKALQAKIIGDRDTAFKKAKQYYEQAIAEATQAMKAIPGDKTADRFNARLAVLKIRKTLADMIFEQWLKTDLDYLQITDRRAGDRQRTIELLKVAGDHYKAALEDSRTWMSELDHMDMRERLKYANTIERQVKSTQREAQYSSDWITYYYAWVLPPDYVPAEKERSRKQMLDDAITAFMAYTKMPDRVSAKWYAHLVIGMAYRELSKFDEALQSLAIADTTKITNPVEADRLKIRVAYERALTVLRQGKKEEARKVIEEAHKTFKEKLDNDIFGIAMNFVEAESYVLEGADKNDPAIRKKGFDILRQMYNRPAPFPTIVEQVTKVLGGGGGTGTETGTTPEDPFAIWIEAQAKLAEGEQKVQTDPKAAGDACKRAADLFKLYAEKAGPKDPKYPDAVYFQAACLLKMGQKAEAAAGFQKVADEFPKYQYAAASSRYTISIRGELYEKGATEENRQGYEDALKWFVAKWIESDPDQIYYYGLILNRGKKYTEAAEAFSKVADKSPLYPDSRYWIPVCRLEHFREKIVPSRDKQLAISTAVQVSRDLLAYVDYAFSMKGKGLPPEKESQLIDWAEAACINAAEVFLYPEVELFDRALPILADTEKKFPSLDNVARGRILKLRIEAYQKLGKLKEANDTLNEFLKVAKADEIGPVLGGLFRAMTEDVRAMVARNTKESLALATSQVDQAKALGESLRDWLNKSALADKAVQIENNRYSLAELYLAVGRHQDALAIYQEIGGMKPHEVAKGQAIKEDCVYGQARAHEGLGETAPDAAQGKAHFETAIDMWRVLMEIASADRGADQARLWECRYHLYYCKFKLGAKQEVVDALKTLKIMQPPLGGKDPAMQSKFLQLLALAGGA
jgi:tetratricopeptide (TPR) repeat protein